MSIETISQEEFDKLNAAPVKGTGLTDEQIRTLQEEAKKLENGEAPPSMIGNNSPEDIFAGMIQIFMPRFGLLLNGLSNNQLRKLMRALVESPLNKKAYDSFDKKAKEAFMIGEKILMAKGALIMQAFSQKIEEERKELAEMVSSEPVATEESTNTVIKE